MQPRRRQVPFRDLPSASREETVKAGRASCFPDIMRQQLFRATLAAVLGEFIGTCLLTLVICTSVAVSVIVGKACFTSLNTDPSC